MVRSDGPTLYLRRSLPVAKSARTWRKRAGVRNERKKKKNVDPLESELGHMKVRKMCLSLALQVGEKDISVGVLPLPH